MHATAVFKKIFMAIIIYYMYYVYMTGKKCKYIKSPSTKLPKYSTFSAM